MEKAQLLIGAHGPVTVLKWIGDLRFTGSGPVTSSKQFHVFIDSLLASEDMSQILVDLSQAIYIDSTHLGLLAILALEMQKTRGCKPTVFSPNPDVTEALTIMGLGSLFWITDTLDSTPENFEAFSATCPPETGNHAAKLLLEAHRVLSDISESNFKAFQNVIKALSSTVDPE